MLNTSNPTDIHCDVGILAVFKKYITNITETLLNLSMWGGSDVLVDMCEDVKVAFVLFSLFFAAFRIVTETNIVQI